MKELRGRPIAHHHRPAAAGRPGADRSVRARASELGVAIVEATFVFIVFFTLVVAIFEGGLYMKDDLAVSHSARAGARALSAMGDEPRADLYAVVGLGRESTALSRRDIVRIVVYKPAGFGEAPTESCRNGIPSPGVCNVYTAADIARAEAQVREEAAALAENRAPSAALIVFGCQPDSPDRHWCPTDRKVTKTGTGPEYVGVWMQARHEWVTKLFGNGRYIEDRSIIRLEPRSDS